MPPQLIVSSSHRPAISVAETQSVQYSDLAADSDPSGLLKLEAQLHVALCATLGVVELNVGQCTSQVLQLQYRVASYIGIR